MLLFFWSALTEECRLWESLIFWAHTVLIINSQPISFEWNSLQRSLLTVTGSELWIVDFRSDLTRVCFLVADQKISGLRGQEIMNIHQCSKYTFCSNLEVFESHLGNLPFDIHHALKVRNIYFDELFPQDTQKCDHSFMQIKSSCPWLLIG